ncbi:MAG: flagellar basal body rod protein FlgC [Synergistaceae bacterium]|nr:flagellar basal body rod protein FlgC [Synergistaceae bacterium]
MKIFDSLEVAGSSLTAHRLWMDTISSNLANITTTRTKAGGPYKRRVPVFAEMLDNTLGGYHYIGGVGVLSITEDNGAPRMAYQPDHPDANAEGYVAYPNVNLVREMTDMLVASRAYEANLSVVTTGRDMWNGALDVMRG